MGKAIKTLVLVGLTVFILLLFGISIVVAQPAKLPSPLIQGYIPLPQMPPAEEFPARLINTAEPVTISNCYPCHQNLDGFKNPNLIFNHTVHFERSIRCRACHLEFPHQPGKIIKPTMERCFMCHGITHGTQGLMAPKSCGTCHPSGFNLVPASHTRPWTNSLHKNENPQNLGACLMCHDQPECNKCHSAKAVAPVKIQIPAPIVQPATEPKPVLIDVSLPVTMSKCSPCHLQLDAFKNPILVFNHPVHLQRGIRCLACHQEYPHQFGEIVKPVMLFCFNCHNLRHGRQGLVAPPVCSTCHPPGFQLKPPSHDALWRRAHGKVAKQNFYYCYSCHQFTTDTLMPNFCQNCHGLPIMPHQTGWKEREHQPIAKQDISICFRCHPSDKSFCNRCHHQPYDPSWGPWITTKQRGLSIHPRVVKALGPTRCFNCHSPAFCPRCHVRAGDRGVSLSPKWEKK